MVSIFVSFLSFLFSIIVFIKQLTVGSFGQSIPWFSVGDIQFTIGYEIHSLNVLMLMLVSFMNLMIQLYSKEYMKDDERIKAYYGKLNLFTFSMLALVISPNLLQIYVFWELVGLGSFLLIGHYNRERAKRAANKAFLMTRIGDVAFLVGLILLFWGTGTFELHEIFHVVQSGNLSEGILTTVGFCLFIGVIGKSAQFPLHTWLPDAMEGPTPVSALLHAATMVAAGIYFIANIYPIFLASSTLLFTMALIGGCTGFFAATIALVEKDVKRVLAYSTISQLGLMLLSLGTIGFVGAIFHLMTHAFFKALLFLSVGRLIKYSGSQSIEHLREIGKRMPVIHLFFLIGAMSMSGIPFLSGYFSKEEILSAVFFNGPPFLFWLAVLTSLLTAIYMFRLYFLLFFGGAKTGGLSPLWMVFPMGILAAGSIFIGYLNTHFFGTFFSDWLTKNMPFSIEPVSAPTSFLSLLTILISLTGLVISYLLFRREWLAPKMRSYRMSRLYRTVLEGYYVDVVYDRVFIKGTIQFAKGIGFVDRFVQKIISFLPKTINGIAKQEVKLRWKNPQRYGLVAVIGLLLILTISIWSVG
ncbi:NADH-quinone oxidoreductase subunit L [Fervidibacillus halotolerans]|uniref:NADH-quinone oxidoreductase subunit L n=1 Tax=Fervidibacillus halotolerans TaxID=2980027 RepID=A0A9E8RWW2_9BACI|nr:NADH-quinone oxidoreductase subunit L [Fervidibacillus halotolerans]WAA12165.1 NADH-quinone oxidoreductase subunit L [Fervidibacillus halotolerans]